MFSWKEVGFLIVLVTIFGFWWKRKPMRDLADKIPGHDGVPVMGMLFYFFTLEAKGLHRF